MIKENIDVKGSLNIVLLDSSGNIIQKQSVKNLVVSTGKSHIAKRLVNNDDPIISFMAIGTSSNIAQFENTQLGNEVARVGFSSVNVINNIITYSATFGSGVPGGTQQIYEAAMFNSAGTMLNRTTFGLITKNPADILTIEWQVTIQ